MATDTSSGTGINLDSLLTSVLGTGSQMYGAQNAAEARTNADLSAINTQRSTMGNITSALSPYTTAGAGATTNLSNALGLGGAAPDPSVFLNMPGYQFAVQQGTQAIQRQATAQGNAYTPNELNTVGQYVTGTAMQDYNTYIGQLTGVMNTGATAANEEAGYAQKTGANISALQQDTGVAQAGGYTGTAGALGGPSGTSGLGNIVTGLTGGLGDIINSITGQNASGTAGGGGAGGAGGTAAGGAAGSSGVLKLISALKGAFGGGTSTGGSTDLGLTGPVVGGGTNDPGLGFIQNTGDGTSYSPYVSYDPTTGAAPNPNAGNTAYGVTPMNGAGNPDWLAGNDNWSSTGGYGTDQPAYDNSGTF